MSYLDNAFALIIGINNYRYMPSLCKAVTDARDIYEVLTGPNLCRYPKEHVHLLLDDAATLKAFGGELKWLASRVKDNLVVTFFFSGHGAQVVNAPVSGSYILMHDSSPWNNGILDARQLESTSVSGTALASALNTIQSHKLTVVFDVCHSGGFADLRNPFFDRARLQRGLSEQIYEILQKERGRVIIASCMPDQVSWERREDRNSIFTTALLAGLRGKADISKDGVSVLGLFRFLGREVPSKAAEIMDPATGKPAEQRPYLKVELADDYVIALAPRPLKEYPPTADLEADHYDVFISYSHADDEAVMRLVTRLRSDGLKVWLDEDMIAAGDPLDEVLARGVERSAHVMVCLSENYLQSKWTTFETGIALILDIDARRRKVIPVKVGACDIPLKLKRLAYADLTKTGRWEQEYGKAIKNIKSSQAGTASGVFATVPVESAGTAANQGGTTKSEPETTFDIQFDNREQELSLIEQRLSDSGASPYMYVCEPAQMGKTFMLRELQKRYNGRQIKPRAGNSNASDPQRWYCAYLDLTPIPICWDKKEDLIAAIMRELGADPGSTIEHLADFLQARREKCERALILLDGTEHLTESTAGFLVEMLRGLEENLFEAAYYPGFVAAGHRLFTAWERTYAPLMLRVELTPFRERVVVHLLERAVKARHMSYEPQWYRHRVAQILQGSAGHPGCIAALVRYFHDKRFVTADLSANTVFSECVIPIIDTDILTSHNLTGGRASVGQLDLDRLARVLMELSIYRIITRPHIEVVARHLGFTLSQKEMDVLEGEVSDCSLVELNENYSWLDIPYTIRRLLERKLGLHYTELSLRHREAAACYDSWLDNIEESSARIPLNGLYQATYIREALLHHALGSPSSGQPLLDFLKSKLHKYVSDLRPGRPGEDVSDVLYRQMREDVELRDVIDGHVREGAYESLLTDVKSRAVGP